ncbi:Clp protease-like protein [Vibrio phage phi 2]|uniref:head maturation protease n=1 Tax=Vibrio phage X29 TaxID=1500713 RepID=UPI00045FD2FC|nr:head maturation protease [Vibrio phage X29]AHN84819.1 Clp protease-like protein [Vibrio phage phi 2]AIA10340.1 protease-like protein [Vibrio phage X29]
MGKPKFWEFKNLAENQTPELLVYGEISEYWGEVDSKSFAKQLGGISSSEINVRINSYGGEVFTAQAIYSLLKSHPASISVFIDGIAASAATIIAMAGDKIIMPSNAMMMIHNPLTGVWGNSSDLREVANLLDKVRETLLATYRAKTGLDDKKLIELLDNETYMTASEALELGFIDEVDQNIKIAASLTRSKMVVNNLELNPERFANMPDNWLNKQSSQEPVNNPATPDNSKVEGEKPMNLEELKAKHPDLYNQIKNEGVKAGEEQERARIKNIEDMAMPGYEQLVNKAKFETPMEANALAVEIIKAQKEKGKNFLAQRQQDSQDLADIQDGVEVPNTVATTAEQDAAELKRLAAIAAKAANGKRNIK